MSQRSAWRFRGFVVRFLLVLALVSALAAAVCQVASAAFPGKNGRIAFMRGGHIWTIRPNGTGVHQVTTNPAAADSDPAWSPNGKTIAFTRVFGPVSEFNLEIVLIHPDGSGFRRLTRNPAIDRDPAWSPTGKRLVFSSERNPVSQSPTEATLFFMNLRTRHTRQLLQTTELLWDLAAAWSPDGKRIAWTPCGEDSCWIDVMRSDGTHPKVLTDSSWWDQFPVDDPGDGDYEPDWGPFGKRLVFDASTNAEDGLMLMNSADGGNRVQLKDPSGSWIHGWSPAFSPDGKQIVFARDDRLYIVNQDGTGEHFLTVGSEPSWQRR
jgi:Tol biopolymer transport system component